MKIHINIPIHLVETMVSPHSKFCGTVLLLEIKDQMESFLQDRLLQGMRVSIKESFEYSWNELVQIENKVIALSDDDSGLES